MKGRGGGFGFIILLVVVAVVLVLATRAWQAVMPTASQVVKPGSGGVEVPDHGQPEAGEALRSSDLPNLDEMRQNTERYAGEVQEAVQELE